MFVIVVPFISNMYMYMFWHKIHERSVFFQLSFNSLNCGNNSNTKQKPFNQRLHKTGNLQVLSDCI